MSCPPSNSLSAGGDYTDPEVRLRSFVGPRPTLVPGARGPTRTRRAGKTSSSTDAVPGWSEATKKQMWAEYVANAPDACPLEFHVIPQENIADAEAEIREDQCAHCHLELTMGRNGFPYCPGCGEVNVHTLDLSPEWGFYSTEDRHKTDRARCGNPTDPLLEQSSHAGKVAGGGATSTEMKILRKWISWQSMPSHEKALYDEFQLIQNLAFAGGITKSIVESAKGFYKDFYERQTHRGLNRDASRVGAIWLACWKHGCPRSANELADIFKIDKGTASMGCTTAEEILKVIEQALPEAEKSKFPVICPAMFVERFCSKLQFPDHLVPLAMFISRRVDALDMIPDNRPQAIAVGVLYFISHHFGLGYSKAAVKHALGSEVSEVTINKCFMKLNGFTDQLIPASMRIDPSVRKKTGVPLPPPLSLPPVVSQLSADNPGENGVPHSSPVYQVNDLSVL